MTTALTEAVADVIEHHVGRPVTDADLEDLTAVVAGFLARRHLVVSRPRNPHHGGMPDDEYGLAGGDVPQQWVVWRQDDNGNRFEVARKDSRADADELASVMEARGHKQLYWVARASS